MYRMASCCADLGDVGRRPGQHYSEHGDSAKDDQVRNCCSNGILAYEACKRHDSFARLG
jgi:hypothetical protein